MKDSKVVNIRHLSKINRFDFKFTIIQASDESVCNMVPPVEFDFMPQDEVEIITSLLMSYFFSAEIFKKSEEAKSAGELGFVPSELIGKVITLSICKSNTSGFTFEHEVPDTIKGCVGEKVIAESIRAQLTAFETSLSVADNVYRIK